jgi:antitoxin (DNA-binding transcriptional repressor) of toxin-antitoxin stability system
MSNMKHVCVREAQHHLARVLALVEAGEENEITRRQSVVARIIPATGSAGNRGLAWTLTRRMTPDLDSSALGTTNIGSRSIELAKLAGLTCVNPEP